MKRAIRLSLLLSACLLSGTAVLAQDAPGGHPGGRPHGPPPEAIAACVGKAVGTTVSFTGRRGETMTGTCEMDGDVLAARPAGGGRPPRSAQ